MTKEIPTLDFDFKSWIQGHHNEGYKIVQEDDQLIKLSTDYGEASIRFTEIEENTIVEFSIVSHKDTTVKFYLHFELKDEDHTKELYDEMIRTLISLKDEKTLRVLLSCSSGLTTSMFAENLNSVADMLGIDSHFDAVSYLSIYEVIENYDVLLIAPQIGYMLNRLKESLPNKLVLQIPTAVFASYDALSAIKFVQNELETFHENKNEESEECCVRCTQYENRILSIVLMISKGQTQIHYRLYDKCEIIDSKIIKKPSMNIYDLYDIIDTVLLKHSYIDMIGIATPGIVKDNKHLKDPTDGKDIDMKADFEKKYGIDVFVYNNANAAVVGFSLEHPEFQNIIFHSQPFGFGVGGQGIISNGKIVKGKNGIAGELRYFIRRMQLSDDVHKLAVTQHGAIELVTKALLSSISIIGPEAVVICAPMTPDMNEVRNVLASFIDEDFLPEFYYIKEAYSYMLSGITKLCVDYLEEE
ncbi:MAG: ROK family protein [Coprobacillus sp.]